MLAAYLFQVNRADARWPENVQSFRNIYPFRFALCLYTYVVEWISTGSNLKVATRNVRNDLIDPPRELRGANTTNKWRLASHSSLRGPHLLPGTILAASARSFR